MKQPQTTGSLIETAQRRAFVLELRRAGATYAIIAKETAERFGIDRLPNGWDERYAYKDVKRELDKLRDQLAESAEEIRALELDRLDRMMLGIWTRARSGDYSAIDRVLKLMKRRADLLGIDAPTRSKSLNVDLAQLTQEQLERIANGDDPIHVLATTGSGGT